MNKKEKNFTMVAIRPKYQRLLRIEAAKRDMKMSELLAEYIMKNNNVKSAYCPACEIVNNFTINENGSCNCSLCGLSYDTIESGTAYNYN